jgi:hypothetical protein
MNDASPCTLFLEWYRGTPPEVREHLAFMIGGLTPKDALAGKSSLEPLGTDELCEQVLALAANQPWREVGVLLMLRAFADFAFRGRSTAEDWEQARANRLKLAAMADQEGKASFAGTLRNATEGLPLRSRQWVRAAEQWLELRQPNREGRPLAARREH